MPMVSPSIFCTHCGAANLAGVLFCYACGQAIQIPSNGLSDERKEALAIGALLRQRYRITQQIGSGGFGAVYRAEDIDLGRRSVAVKEMSQHNLNAPEIAEAAQGFKQEALLLADLMHEHLPRIYDHFFEGGRWYLVMDYIRGETLEERLAHAPHRRLPWQEALRLALQLCTVLDYLHTRQPPIIFRDLKPSNVILSGEGQLFLIDFGIARHFKPGQARDTVAFGSPGYAPPEQYGRTQTTPRADIYSLGAMLHQMLSGDDPSLRPFRFAPLPFAAPALQALLTRMLQMDESQRPASMAEVKRELQRLKDQPPGAVSQVALSVPQVKKTLKPLLSQPGEGDCSFMLRGYSSPVHAVSWSPQSTHIASASSEGVYIWDIKMGKGSCLYGEHRAPLVAMAWSSDATRIASLSQDGDLRVWDPSTGATVSENPGGSLSQAGARRLLSWSPDARLLAVAGDKRTIETIDVEAEARPTALQGRSSQGYTTLNCSPDGQRLAATSENTVYIWDLASRSLLLTYEHSARLTALDWAPNALYIASCGYGKIIQIWHTQTRQLLSLCKSDKMDHINVLSWSADSRSLLSGDIRGNVQRWHARTGEKTRLYSGHTDSILSLSCSSDGLYLASGSADLTMRAWKGF